MEKSLKKIDWYSRFTQLILIVLIITFVVNTKKMLGAGCVLGPICDASLSYNFAQWDWPRWFAVCYFPFSILLYVIWLGWGLLNKKIQNHFVLYFLHITTLLLYFSAFTFESELIESLSNLGALVLIALTMLILNKLESPAKPAPDESLKDKPKGRLVSIVVLFAFLFLSVTGQTLITSDDVQKCNAFPACYNEVIIGQNTSQISVGIFFPTPGTRQASQMIHRFAALVFIGALIVQVLLSMLFVWPHKVFRINALVLILTLLNLLLAVVDLLIFTNLSLSALHLLLSYLLFALIFKITIEMYARAA